MSRPVKRGFLPNGGLEFGNLTEAQYNFNTAHVKRQRQAFDDRHNTAAVPNPRTVQQETFSLNVSHFTDPQPTSTDLEPGCGVLFHDNADWAFNLQTDISDLPLSFSTSRHSGIPGYEFSAMLDPNFRYADGTVTDSDLQMTIDLGSKNSNTLKSDEGNSDDALPQDLGNVDLAGSVPPIGSHFITSTNISWINDGEQGPVQQIVCIV
jgi:hypothetical protein